MIFSVNLSGGGGVWNLGKNRGAKVMAMVRIGIAVTNASCLRRHTIEMMNRGTKKIKNQGTIYKVILTASKESPYIHRNGYKSKKHKLGRYKLAHKMERQVDNKLLKREFG
jgi:hypothetical protein